MLVPKCFPSQLDHQDRHLKSLFSLLVWNVHKENQRHDFIQTLQALTLKYPSDFLLFQEVRHPKTSDSIFKEYSYALASNIETNKSVFGVTTAAKVAFEKIDTTLSKKRELGGLATHKSLLITEHRQDDGTPIYIVNLHAINFVSLKSFTLELKKVEKILQRYDGSLIIGGDFNNWSKRRSQVLESFQKGLGLQKAEIAAPHHVKAVFSKPIDHIFYRGVTLIKAEAIDTKKVSDHNPIYATFKLTADPKVQD